MLTRRRAALLKSSGDILDQENLIPTPLTTTRKQSHKTPRRHPPVSADQDVERPLKRRREHPAEAKPERSSLLNFPSDAFVTPRASTGIAAPEEYGSPDAAQFKARSRENKFWTWLLYFSLCFVFTYGVFWILLVQLAPEPPVTTESVLSELKSIGSYLIHEIPAEATAETPSMISVSVMGPQNFEGPIRPDEESSF
eukprot:Blabericola_migrator_1__7682@NODE_391_length_9042_cov_77_341616_g312_i0_p5_GENE_NODE_391_length_9042_cov_77_341616_g312_i0NODE_391_length_9042_cov_77_341616_g312_i0_p5_ORF_typecomplete_len197_score22_32DUF805/PF05656_14/0_068LAP1C/PF05609_12/0_19DUF2208/PF09973_9/0_23Babuvirus_MP/PF07234_11/0_37_NODE_391_length_9042_cov_77_341616_g312_i049025492